ncbi:NUDIX domain-containing protein [Cecembia lonarensis]|uniref:Bifunctional NMN adenylyltransferase/Nudix hydrolase n=1 Tax=Cecembia lonarensis (strain CCUG 58316 / KCTC 22772 / LW9) TaxID=1225176 RepID=K1L7X1_CECL9|nr:NUDIX hydrolase [Cecembia lonarensis]EKB48207.1 Bifunctional NMN adenylyltransferase/Nudix hydrolase [Cecembia lonarensis LW9]
MSFTYSFPRPALTTDAVVICGADILLIERKKDPYQGRWALPGGFVDEYEAVEDACVRELEEETSLSLSASDAHFVGVFGKEGRDPRGWTVSVVYLFEVSQDQKYIVAPGSDSEAVRWFSLAQLPELAFDHKEIIGEVLRGFE